MNRAPTPEHVVAKRPAVDDLAWLESMTGGPVISNPPPKIDEKLAMLLRGKKATLSNWMLQHKDDGIPSILAAFAAAIEVIDRHI
jgi:hypothetical protein